MSQISLQNLKKSFGKTQVIHDLSIDVKDGELIVIVGPSGCGKSTLLRMVAGLEDANEGNILIDNKKVNELEPMERNIAMVFQNYALYPHMTVFGNMAYGLKIAKVPKEEIESRVQKAAEILEKDGIECEIIDLRTLRPIDYKTILDSVKKTNRLVILEEAWPFGNISTDISHKVQNELFDYLDAPIEKVNNADTPTPYSPVLLEEWLPNSE